MENRFLSLLGFSLLACASFNASANTSSDSIRAELEKLRLVNVKCAAVSNDPFDAKHLNCYTNVYNRASQLGSLASKYINNEEAPRVLADHNRNFTQLLANCDQLYAGQTAKYKTLSMQCKATNKLGWAMFIPALMK